MATLNPRDVVIVDGVRSAMGKTKNGMFRNVRADSLSAELVRALVARNQFDTNEVEDVIAMMNGVAEVAVIGVPFVGGEKVKAFIVKKDPNLKEEDILQHCRQELTAYKVPKEIEFRVELPKSNVGKILRRILREQSVEVEKK